MRNSDLPVTPPEVTGDVLVDDADRELLPADDGERAVLTASDFLAWALDDPSLGGAAALIESVDPQALDGLGRLEYLELANRLERQAAAMRMRAVACLAGPEPTTDEWRERDFTDCEVAAALELSAPAGARQVRAARQLTGCLPGTMAALGRGDIGYLQALSIVEGTYGLDPVLLGRVEELVLAKAVGQSPGQTRALVARTIARVAPEALAEKERRARKAADVTVLPGDDGTAQIWADRAPAADAALVGTAVDAYARSAKAQGDPRTLGSCGSRRWPPGRRPT